MSYLICTISTEIIFIANSSAILIGRAINELVCWLRRQRSGIFEATRTTSGHSLATTRR